MLGVGLGTNREPRFPPYCTLFTPIAITWDTHFPVRFHYAPISQRHLGRLRNVPLHSQLQSSLLQPSSE